MEHTASIHEANAEPGRRRMHCEESQRPARMGLHFMESPGKKKKDPCLVRYLFGAGCSTVCSCVSRGDFLAIILLMSL